LFWNQNTADFFPRISLMNTDRNQILDTCHPERSEGSSRVAAPVTAWPNAYAFGYWILLPLWRDQNDRWKRFIPYL
jgi:hypothetical protein